MIDTGLYYISIFTFELLFCYQEIFIYWYFLVLFIRSHIFKMKTNNFIHFELKSCLIYQLIHSTELQGHLFLRLKYLTK